MDLYDGRIDGSHRVPQRHRRMGVAAGIEDNTVDILLVSGVKMIDQGPFPIVLPKGQVDVREGRIQLLFDGIKRGRAVGIGLTGAEQV